MNLDKLKEHVTPLTIAIIAFILRLLHNQAMLANPLYYYPIGGHRIYFDLAHKIFNGDLNPFNGPISVNEPIYAYILALQYCLFGDENFLAIRIISLICDSVTCLLIYILASHYFNKQAGLFAGIIAACCGPLIFYADELTVMPYVLLALTAAIYYISKVDYKNKIIAGILIGFATLCRPDILITVILLIIYLVIKNRDYLKSAFIFSVFFLITISPLTILNYHNSGRVIPFTTSAGHNFYIGHNDQSTAGYTLPEGLDGDIFLSMQAFAEKNEQKKIAAADVSSYYFKKTFANILNNPQREITLLTARIKAFFGDYEATTYADYYYQKYYSPILVWSLSTGILIALFLIALLVYRKQIPIILLIPILAALINVLTFFFISRLRLPALPFFCIFAGAGFQYIVKSFLEKKYLTSASLVIMLLSLISIFKYPLIKPDTSNEWNKVSIVYKVLKRYDLAIESLEKAIEINPNNPNSYLNLQVLYRQTGANFKADQLQEVINLMEIQKNQDLNNFSKNLKNQIN